jgi:hypothetical protein
MNLLLKTDGRFELCNISGDCYGINFELYASSLCFKGQVPYCLERSELRDLIDDLRKMYTRLWGTAELRTHRDEHGATFTINQLGCVQIDVVMIHYADPVHRLEVTLFSDQSCLPEFINELEEVGKACGCL